VPADCVNRRRRNDCRARRARHARRRAQGVVGAQNPRPVHLQNGNYLGTTSP
jgi:hypothetical protein